MKHQQVVPDYYNMFKSSCTCLLLAFSGYVLLKMIQAIFWLPGYLEKNQRKLEEIAQKYAVELENQTDGREGLLENNSKSVHCNMNEKTENEISIEKIDDNSKPENDVVEAKKIK